MTKINKFHTNLTNTLNNINTIEAKLTIGDSINNNRSLTVNQVVRYLRISTIRGSRRLANNIETLYNEIAPMIVNTRDNNRSDAIDCNEFSNFIVDNIVNGNTDTRRTFGNLITV